MCTPTANNGRSRGPRLLQGVTLAVLGLIVVAMFSETEMFKLYNDATQKMSSQVESFTSSWIGLDPTNPVTATAPTEQPRLPIHLLFALCGNHPGFFGEFKVALKSALLNAPHNRDTYVHIMADQKAYDSLPTVWNETRIDGVEWWRNITIIPYNVEPRLKEWAKILKNGTGLGAGGIHTFGTYFRLFANTILPSDVEYALYIDTDVVFLANTAHLFDNLPRQDTTEKPAPLFFMAKDCAGVMLVNVARLDKFWDYVNAIKWSRSMLQHMDQSIVIGVGQHYPGTVELLPAAWDLTLAEHFGKAKNQERLVGFRPEAGIFHYNGGAANKNAYYDQKFVERHPDGFGLPAIFYRDLPWPWVKFMGKSVGAPANTGIRINDNSHSIKWIEKSEHMVATQLFPIAENTATSISEGEEPSSEINPNTEGGNERQA